MSVVIATSDAQLRIGESRDSGFDAEPVIGPRLARTRWHRPGMTESGSLPLRNDVKLKSTYDFATSRRVAPELCIYLPPP
jgi:hypothetical protein